MRYWAAASWALVTSGFDVVPVSDQDLREGRLPRLDVFVMPGGSSTGKARAIQPSGAEAIKTLISSGAGYVGICAGAYLAAGYSPATLPFRLLEDASVLNVRATDSGLAPFYTIAGRVAVRPGPGSHPVFAGMGEEFVMAFERGPLFRCPDELVLARISSIAVVDRWYVEPERGTDLTLGAPAAIEGRYGRGRVLLFSGHPEAPGNPWCWRILQNSISYLCSEGPFEFDLGEPWCYRPRIQARGASGAAGAPGLSGRSAMFEEEALGRLAGKAGEVLRRIAAFRALYERVSALQGGDMTYLGDLEAGCEALARSLSACHAELRRAQAKYGGAPALSRAGGPFRSGGALDAPSALLAVDKCLERVRVGVEKLEAEAEELVNAGKIMQAAEVGKETEAAGVPGGGYGSIPPEGAAMLREKVERVSHTLATAALSLTANALCDLLLGAVIRSGDDDSTAEALGFFSGNSPAAEAPVRDDGSAVSSRPWRCSM